MLREEGFGSPVCQLCARFVAAIAHRCSKTMIEPLVIMQRHARVIVQPGMNGLLSLWRHKAV